jgi:hypothetical protein
VVRRSLDFILNIQPKLVSVYQRSR